MRKALVTDLLERGDKPIRFVRWAFAAVLLVISVQILFFLAVYWAIADWPTRGQFGDLFGAANALFSGLAFVGVVFALLLQQKQLELQNHDISVQKKATRDANQLGALTLLLDHYSERLVQLEKWEKAGLGPASLLQEKVQTTEKIVTLKKTVEKLYGELFGGDYK